MDTYIFASPIGGLKLTADDRALYRLDFTDHEHECRAGFPKSLSYDEMADQVKDTDNIVLKQTITELAAYFAKKTTDFTVPLYVEHSGTAFQRQCWRALRDIQYGITCTYKDIAEKVGSPKAFRAVGGANHNNPIAIILPCHRVVGGNQKMVGFGGGLWRKVWLLNHEKAQGELF